MRARRRIYAGVRKTKLQPCAWLAQPGGGKVLLKLESEQARSPCFGRRCAGSYTCVQQYLSCRTRLQH